LIRQKSRADALRGGAAGGGDDRGLQGPGRGCAAGPGALLPLLPLLRFLPLLPLLLLVLLVPLLLLMRSIDALLPLLLTMHC